MKCRNKNICLSIFLVLGTLIAVQPALSETVKFIAPGLLDPVIVVGTGATESDLFAAEELSSHLAKMTSRKIAVMDELAYSASLSDDGNMVHRKVIAEAEKHFGY